MIRYLLAYAKYKRLKQRYRDIHLTGDLVKSDPHTMTRNATMKLMLGIGPNERAVDPEGLELRRLLAQQELRQMQRENEKVKAAK